MAKGDQEKQPRHTELDLEKPSDVLPVVDELMTEQIAAQDEALTPEQQKELYESLKQGLSALESIAIRLEKSRIADYADLMGRPKKLLIRNFMGGIARGVGFSFGFSVLVATIIYVLNLLVGLDLPLIGDFIANLLDYVDAVRSFR